MPDNDDFDRLRLIRSSNIGPVTYRQLLARFGSATGALAELPNLVARGGGRKFTAISSGIIEREMAATQKAGGKYVFLGDPQYPSNLTQMDNAPPAICFRGNIGLSGQMTVAMVGARNASAGACRFARQLAHDLGQLDLVVASGLARGIDTAAHVGAIATGTIAVIAGGIDNIYPPENARLQDEIAEKGLLLAEQPPGTEPRARHFPYRNRIIAGLASGTVVVEAAPKSGSLITARLAGDAGREVMAVPGSPMDPRARGCNQLIRDGATLVQDAHDIAEIIRPIDVRMAGRAVPATGQPSFWDDASHNIISQDMGDDERRAVTGLLGMTGVSVDELVRQSGMTPSVVHMILLELELAGRLERGAGAKVRLTA